MHTALHRFDFVWTLDIAFLASLALLSTCTASADDALCVATASKAPLNSHSAATVWVAKHLRAECMSVVELVERHLQIALHLLGLL